MLMTVILAAALVVPGEAELKARLPDIFAKSAAHYKALDAAATPLRKGEMSTRKGRHNSDIYIPHGWNKWKTGKDELDMRPIFWWTAGHYPGSLWYLYEATGDAFFKDRALDWTRLLAPNSQVDDNHDVGFIMNCSFGNARRLLKTEEYDALLVETAEYLSRRFNEKLGVIRSWGAIDETDRFLVIPDNMMNLELLMRASEISGNPRFAAIARSHADVTMRHHFDADGGAYHVLNYCQEDGLVQEIRRGQGAQVGTAWSRGQSWSIYGYTMMYRETKDPKYLAFAQKVADYAIRHPNMPADGIPYWDYGMSGAEDRDSSAGAIMASGLLELAGFVEGGKGAAYRAFAVKQLLALSSPDYFSEGGEIGHFLLKHGVGAKSSHSEVDTPLNYGDYYFLEALLRFRDSSPAQAAVRPQLILDIPGADWNWKSDRTIRQDLKKVLADKPVAVTDKKRIPDSGDRHDYMSFGDYWWPNDFTTNGLPFVRKDGVVNPEAYNDSDRKRVMKLCDDVATLAAARVRLGDAAAGREGARRIRIFFLDPETAMNPNLNYAQAIPGICKGRGIGVIDTVYLAYRFVDAAILLHSTGDLSDADFVALKDWFSKYIDWLLTSENGVAESKSLNNHGTAWSLQTIVFAAFVGRDDIVRRLLAEVPERRVGPQVAPNGMPTFELNRTQSFHYSTFIAEMLCMLANFGERYGIDIWSYEAANGGSVVKLMEWMMPFLQREKPWEFEQGWPYELQQGVSTVSLWNAYRRSDAARRPVRKADPWTFEQTMNEAWFDVLHSVYDKHTHLLYEAPLNTLPMPNDILRGKIDRVGSCMEDSVPNTAAMLLTALARWDATKDAESEKMAEVFYDGLRQCATLSGEPGQVVESICAGDFKSYYPVTRYTHYTAFAFALAKLRAHPLAAQKGWTAEVAQLLADAAAFCERKGVDAPEVLAAAGKPASGRPTTDDATCGMTELVRRQMADRLLYDCEKDAARRAELGAALTRRTELVVGTVSPSKRLDALWDAAKDDLYAPFDKDQTAVRDYVKEVGERMVVQMLCPERPVSERDDFEQRIRAIDFTKPCWYPPVAALWFYWEFERKNNNTTRKERL